jgi:hypothetical protein
MVSSSAITIGTDLLHFFPNWTLYSSINSHLWSHNCKLSEYGGFLILPYTHHMVSFWFQQQDMIVSTSAITIGTNLLHFLTARIPHSSIIPTTWSDFFFLLQYVIIYVLSVITIGTNLLHFFPAWTPHSSINSHLWSNNENNGEYGGFKIFADTHHEVSYVMVYTTPAITIGTSIKNFFPAWTPHSSINSYFEWSSGDWRQIDSLETCCRGGYHDIWLQWEHIPMIDNHIPITKLEQ